MKKLILLLSFFATFMSFAGVSFSKEKASAQKTVDPTPSPSVSPTDTPTPQPRWVPPPPLAEENRFFKYNVSTYVANDLTGFTSTTFADVLFRRRLDQYDTTAEGDVRFGKSFSGSDNIQTIDLRTGKISYTAPFLTCTVGRIDFGGSLSPMEFFGNYSTQGIVRADGIQVTLPISFSLGVQELEKVESRSTALSFFYFPSLLSAQYANIDTTQAYVLGQIRVAANISGMPLVVRLNAGQSANDYFTDSALSGNLAFDGSAELSLDHDFSVYGNFADQNINDFGNTDVAAFGFKAQHLYTFGAISIDEVVLETQVPMFSSLTNAFAGGNNFNMSLATLPQTTFFGAVKARLSAINLVFSITNTPGDFTFARLNSSNSALPGGPIGLGNQTPYLGVPLVASSYSNFAFNVGAGVEF